MKKIGDLPTPAILIDADKMEANLRRKQATCDAAGVELWPHIKTHKMVPILRRQLELGARGATCARIGEAEAILASGVKNLFIARSLVDVRAATRLHKLHEQLDRLILAVTSEAASELARLIRGSRRMELIGLYTHEGHVYGATSIAEVYAAVDRAHHALSEYREAVGGGLPLWPGCSATAAFLSHRLWVQAVRPGSYVFGDLFLSEGNEAMAGEDPAATVLATVLDRPPPGLALIDAVLDILPVDARDRVD